MIERIDFDRDGWKVEVRADDGIMQVTGRSPRNTRHLLLHLTTIEGAGVLGRPALVTMEDGRQVELVTATD